MNINQLAQSLGDRAVALEVITWLRDNELLADNSGNIATDTKLAEQFAFFGQEEKEILSQIHKILAGDKK